MNADSIIQIDFGHRSVDITLATLRRWDSGETSHDDICKKLRLKNTTPVDAIRELVSDIAAQTPRARLFPCISCGAETYGARGVMGSECCDACDELAGLDNMVNDSGELIDEETRADVLQHLQTIHANGGNARRALEMCDFLADVLPAFNAWHHDHVGAGEGREDHSIC